jgi:hypothetical protein
MMVDVLRLPSYFCSLSSAQFSDVRCVEEIVAYEGLLVVQAAGKRTKAGYKYVASHEFECIDAAKVDFNHTLTPGGSPLLLSSSTNKRASLVRPARHSACIPTCIAVLGRGVRVARAVTLKPLHSSNTFGKFAFACRLEDALSSPDMRAQVVTMLGCFPPSEMASKTLMALATSCTCKTEFCTNS